MKHTFINILLFLCCCNASLYGQHVVMQRILLIGDAGEINTLQKAVIDDAVTKVLPGKTIAVFLGDNIYPRGMEAAGADSISPTEDILRKQYVPLRQAGIPVYFIPGNHDWDKSGVNGYQKIQTVNTYFNRLQDSLLQMIPKDGCPGPYELAVGNNLLIIAMDSEWWLFPYYKNDENSDCECKTQADVLGKLDDIVRRNIGKTIIFVTHHPFKTYGSHGGFYSWKEHVFPFASLKKNLYIPLPVVGSLYPLLRKTFPPAQDVKNILYQDMKVSIEDVLKDHPNIIHASGHEHTLQLIQGSLLQIVSGAGCKNTPVKMGKGSMYAESNSGYTVTDLMDDKSLRIVFYSHRNGKLDSSFTYNKPYKIPVAAIPVAAQIMKVDTITTSMPGNYNSVSKIHRRLFGENYRSVWATQVKLPVLHLFARNLTPTERGGGMQTRSLRLQDAEKKEWVLRSVDKYPDALLPRSLLNTFAAKVVKDNVTAAFPYASLVVPVFADALQIPHASPQVVYVAPDNKLGIYNKDFAGTINLFEQREPMGKSTATAKMMEKLKEDNDNAVDQQAYLRARLLDVFLGDWDRHADQWRWYDGGTKKNKIYKPIPRDRDQGFYINQGLFPRILSLPWIQPKFQGFGGSIKNINTFSFNARLIDGLFTNNISYQTWMDITGTILAKLTDSLIATALTKIPAPVYSNTHVQLQQKLESRRAALLHKSPEYFRFLNKVVDITASDKNELVQITDTANKHLIIRIYKISKKDEVEQQLFYRNFDPAITKEINLYLFAGNDSVVISKLSSSIKIRLIGDAKSVKKYEVSGTVKQPRKIHIYDGKNNSNFYGEAKKTHLHLSNASANTSFAVTNRYNKTIPLFTIGANVDDGLILGGGVKFIKQGFRKQPYASTHQLNLRYAFATNSYRLKYYAEWLKLLGTADLLLTANILAPDNAQNFFGRGNETVLNKSGNFRRFYRTIFTTLLAEPLVRWRQGAKTSFAIGPSVQYYHYSKDDNSGRLITNTALIKSYDSLSIGDDKLHAGLVLNFRHDSRNALVLPNTGSFFNVTIKGYEGLNNYSRSFMQATAELAFYKPVDRKSAIVIGNRIGGGVSIGKTAFYQSLFLGGHENLLGYRQFRFAGQHMLYNNLEARIKVANIASYLIPGQLGLVGFYDVGRVWENNDDSKKWHQGAGAGIYFSPAQLLLLQLIAGKSAEGWYPYFTMGFRF